jgi:hypothetical protein|tara:strand:+ start:1325 stop:1594 length:270 start_codon:yes stop_codon:yes gene_type:complete
MSLHIVVKQENHQSPLPWFTGPTPVAKDSTPVERMEHKLQTQAGPVQDCVSKPSSRYRSVLGFRHLTGADYSPNFVQETTKQSFCRFLV